MCTLYMAAHLCMWLCICVRFWIILQFFFLRVADEDYHELANACDINYMFICSLKIRRLHV